MAPKSKQASPQASRCSCAANFGGWLKIFAVLLGVLAPVFYMLEQNLERFYIFKVDHLADVAKRHVETYGNDTRAIVDAIVAELHGEVSLTSYVNRDEEWIFNNAGGAMGAMYIIHASEFTIPLPLFPLHPPY